MGPKCSMNKLIKKWTDTRVDSFPKKTDSGQQTHENTSLISGKGKSKPQSPHARQKGL